MKISIIGTGYVGLVQGAVFADNGNSVICMDIDQEKVEMLNNGIVPIFEPGLEEIIRHNTHDGRIEFTTSLQVAVERADIIFLCLPTPQSEDGSADLSYVLGVAGQIADLADDGMIIVSKSTVPVGTVDKIKALFRKKGKTSVDVVANPEFLKEGAAVQDSLKPDRIVIGTRSKKAQAAMSELYAPFVRTGNPILFMDERSAEMTKYASNAFLATKISFMNELANLCEDVGADVSHVREGMGSDPRIGAQFLFPGVGYGGSCFPKDVRALIKTASDHAHQFRILSAVHEVNESQKRLLLRKVETHFGSRVKGKTIAVWGLSFKPQTDDMREAPSEVIVKGLQDLGAKVHVHDPVAMHRARTVFGEDVKYFNNSYECLKGVHALMIITEWNEFRRPDFERMKSLMQDPVVFDGRNVYDPSKMKERGFTYFGIGRKPE